MMCSQKIAMLKSLPCIGLVCAALCVQPCVCAASCSSRNHGNNEEMIKCSQMQEQVVTWWRGNMPPAIPLLLPRDLILSFAVNLHNDSPAFNSSFIGSLAHFISDHSIPVLNDKPDYKVVSSQVGDEELRDIFGKNYHRQYLLHEIYLVSFY